MHRTSCIKGFLCAGFLHFALFSPATANAHDAAGRLALPKTQAEIETADLLDTPRFTLYVPSTQSSQELGKVGLMQNALSILNETYDEAAGLFDRRPKDKVILRFLSPSEFHERTGAPEWTSAMYLKGEISIPVADPKRINYSELKRAIRHEYLHAVISEISGRRCPAWLDEGLAQLFEGEVNPLLGPSLRTWIRGNEAMPLDWLDQGFMTLSDDIVPVAYAQSLFATRMLVGNFGYAGVAKYLSHLKDGKSENAAFQAAFNMSMKDFQKTLTPRIQKWSVSAAEHP